VDEDVFVHSDRNMWLRSPCSQIECLLRTSLDLQSNVMLSFVGQLTSENFGSRLIPNTAKPFADSISVFLIACAMSWAMQEKDVCPRRLPLQH
jgi:hypothetical protein